MKKLFGIAAVAVCVSLVGAGQARAVEPAAGPFMVTFEDFCDCITYRNTKAGGTGWIHGTWDWECNGDFTLAHGWFGNRTIGTHPIDSAGNPAGISMTIDMVVGGITGHADVAGTVDGVNNILIADDTDYVRTAGTCPGQPFNNGKPSLASRLRSLSEQ